MERLLRRLFLSVVVLLVGASILGCGESTPEGGVHVLRYDGEVNAIMEGYLDRGIGRAEDNGGKLVIIELDTPGGFDTSMRAIVKRIERSTVPIVVYVSPAGGRAASAGTFITMSANIAVMAPNTSIGAASAINSDGSDIGGTLGKKIENDAVAFIRGIAELRGRNADWAEKAVRDAIASNQNDAVSQHVVDFVATSRDELLTKIDGTDTKTGAGQPVHLEGLTTAPIVKTDLTLWERLLGFIADPTVASLLITIGFFALLMELFSPGLVVPGMVGVICLALGFIGLGTLPIDTIGIVLIAAGLVFIALEIYTGTGLLAAGGIIAVILGGIIAFRGSDAGAAPSWLLVIPVLILVAGLFISIAIAIAQVRRRVAEMGTSALIGKIATARTPLTPDGMVFIQGERWQAHLDRGTAREGERVRIIGAEGFRLRVKKEDQG